MASLFIKDPATVAAVDRLSKRTGKSKTALVRDWARKHEQALERENANSDFDRKLAEFYRRFPPESPAVTPNHKAFFDAMWGDPD